MNQDDPIFPGHEIDPYAPPAANLGEAPFGDESSSELAEVEAIRKKHLATEVSIKSLGSLHILAAIFLLSGLAESAIVVFSGRMRDRPSAPFIGMMIYMVFITGVNFFLGFGLRSLNVWARWTDVVVICLGFLVNAAPWIRGAGGAGRLGSSPVIAIPSLLVQICILFLLLGKQGAFVFTPEYRRVIEMTPYVKYRTSWLVKGCLVVLVALLLVNAAPWIRGAGGAGRLGSSPVIAIPSLLVQICILFLLLGKQGAFVFTPEYRRVIEMTPHVKYRTSWLFKGCLVVLFPLFALLIITALFVPRL